MPYFGPSVYQTCSRTEAAANWGDNSQRFTRRWQSSSQLQGRNSQALIANHCLWKWRVTELAVSNMLQGIKIYQNRPCKTSLRTQYCQAEQQHTIHSHCQSRAHARAHFVMDWHIAKIGLRAWEWSNEQDHSDEGGSSQPPDSADSTGCSGPISLKTKAYAQLFRRDIPPHMI